MGHITIKDLDDAVIEALQSRADRHGRSVEDEVRDIVTKSVHKPFTPEERVAFADRVRAMTRPGPHPLAEELIRQDRDSR
ncbi:FitA-like ribbon-helix-helix domain-containing protein [Azospirillum sp. sgz302134]